MLTLFYRTYWSKAVAQHYMQCSPHSFTFYHLLSQIAMGPPTTLFLMLFALLWECFHSISVLTANFQATSDTSFYPLNHLTAIFYQTTAFSLLPIHHPPSCGIYVPCIYPFSPAFISPCVFLPGVEMMSTSLTPHHMSQGEAPTIADSFTASWAVNAATTPLSLPQPPQGPASHSASLLIDLKYTTRSSHSLRNQRNAASDHLCP